MASSGRRSGCFLVLLGANAAGFVTGSSLTALQAVMHGVKREHDAAKLEAKRVADASRIAEFCSQLQAAQQVRRCLFRVAVLWRCD